MEVRVVQPDGEDAEVRAVREAAGHPVEIPAATGQTDMMEYPDQTEGAEASV
jgi:hypothetical protein